MRAAFRALAAIFAFASAYHVYALVCRIDPNGGRHATFAVINAFVALLMIRRPPGFAIAFALLVGNSSRATVAISCALSARGVSIGPRSPWSC